MTKESARDKNLELTLSEKSDLKTILQTNNWSTLEILHILASQVNFFPVERDLREPEKAADIRMKTWVGKLEERKNEIQKANPNHIMSFIMIRKQKTRPCMRY